MTGNRAGLRNNARHEPCKLTVVNATVAIVV